MFILFVFSYGKYFVNNAYNPSISDVFWASEVRQGQMVSIILQPPRKLSRIVVETGYSNKVGLTLAEGRRFEPQWWQ
jgi:hypothetical protein